MHRWARIHCLKTSCVLFITLRDARNIFHHKKIMRLRYRAELDVSFTSNHSKIFIMTCKINTDIFKISIINVSFFYLFVGRNIILISSIL